jgi:predicted RNase H-like HicB family nuclease
MTHYIALIHKDPDSCYGVSFPDVPGVIAAGDTLDEAPTEAAEALAFAAEGWTEDTEKPFLPRGASMICGPTPTFWNRRSRRSLRLCRSRPKSAKPHRSARGGAFSRLSSGRFCFRDLVN